MYIGKIPATGAFQKCDAISVVNGQAAYTLQVGSTNVSPESVNHMIVSLNGVIQAPTTAYTVAGAVLTFDSNLATGDVIDFVLLLGNVLDVGTPTDNTVATAKIQDDAVTLAKMAAGTDGNVISYDASGNPVAIATGNDGQVLTSAGAGQPPAFEAAAGGAWNLLSTTTASNDATVDIETTIDSTYKNYAMIYSDLVPATDNVSLYIRLAVGGTYATSGYDFATNGVRSNSSGGSNDVSTSAAYIMPSGYGLGSSTGEVGHGILYLWNPSGTTYSKQITGLISHVDASNQDVIGIFAGSNKTQTAVNGIQIYFSSGNVATGTFKLYGIS